MMTDRSCHKAISHKTSLSGVHALTLMSDHAFPRHSHDQFGVGYIVQGAQRSWSGRGMVEAQAGDLITVNPGEIHDGRSLTEQGRYWHMIYIDPTMLLRQFANEGLCASAEWAQPVAHNAVLSRLFLSVYKRLTHPEDSSDGKEEQLLLLIDHLFAQLGSTQRKPVESQFKPDLKLALERLKDAPEAPLSLSELAEQVHLSRFQLIRAFKCQLGITPFAYLSQLRVNRAKRLIGQGLPLSDVSYTAGFSDQSHLCRAFRNQFGITPGRWKKITSR